MGNNYSPDISFSIKRHDMGGSMVLKLRKSKIVWLQLFIAFILTIEPKLFTQYTITVLIYAVGNLAIFAAYFYKVCKDGKISKYLFAWICLRLYFLLIMIINGNLSDIDQWGYLTLMVCNYILIIEWCVQNNYLKEMLTALSAVCLIFIFINAVSKAEFLPREYAEGFIKLLNPICPCITEEMWQELGHDNTIAYESWPMYDESKIVVDTIEIPIQVNGKLRGRITVNKDANEDEIKQKALEEVKSFVANGYKKIIYIPNRIFNIVV